MARLKDLKRMCDTYTHCSDCPLWTACPPEKFPDNADEIVDKWVSEHPIKTYAMDFFEKFPDARIYKRDSNDLPPWYPSRLRR